MSCPDCEQAKATPTWGGYHADCPGCKARMAARSHAFFESRRLGRQTGEYRALLKRLGVDHNQAREWAEKDAEARGSC